MAAAIYRGIQVLGKSVNVRITDADKDLTDAADKLTAVVEVYRPKTDSEIELELAAKVIVRNRSIWGEEWEPEAPTEENRRSAAFP